MEDRLSILLVPVNLRKVAIPVCCALGKLDGTASVKWSHQAVLDRFVASHVGSWLWCEFVDLVCAVWVLLAGQDGTFTVQVGVSASSPEM